MKDRYKKTVYGMFIVLISILPRMLSAAPRVAVYQLQAPTMNMQTVQTVDSLVFSFIKELKNYTILDSRSQPVPNDFSPEISADFMFFGILKEETEGIKLELVLKAKEEQLTRKISKVYENVNRILLDSRLLVLNLFDFSVSLEALADSAAGNKQSMEFGHIETVDSLAGSWKGEAGIERIMILRGGRGMAVFSSGVSISLEFKIENGYLLVTQKGTLQPRQFLSLPDDIAKQAIHQINPPHWRFLVSTDKKVLSGTKTDAQIQYNENTITDIQYITAGVEWMRD